MSTATKTSKKVTTKAQATQKKEFNLERFITLWIYKSEKGSKYLSGTTEDKKFKLTGFFNNEKQNPKEPDIRIYVRDDEKNLSKEPYISLWCNVKDGSDKKYLSGKIDDKKVVGFFNAKAKVNGTMPYINIYFSEAQAEQEKIKEENETVYEDVAIDEDLPF